MKLAITKALRSTVRDLRMVNLRLPNDLGVQQRSPVEVVDATSNHGTRRSTDVPS
jgi:hypothetical protein